MHGQHFFAILIYNVFIKLTEKSAKLEVVGTQLMPPNSFLIVKNQQCIVFDNVLKIIIVYKFIAIIVTSNSFSTPLPSTTGIFCSQQNQQNIQQIITAKSNYLIV